jgi:thiamine kinase-like enzyme
MSDATDAMLSGLRRALERAGSLWASSPLHPLPDTGLAHWHVRIVGSGTLARIPKQSQLNLPPTEHLAYEAACFERAAPSGHTPLLHGVLAPQNDLRRGALLVDEVIGRPLALPSELTAMVQALAAIHRLPVPDHSSRAPLRSGADAIADLTREIDQQAEHLDAAQLDARARAAIDHELLALRQMTALAARPPTTLIGFDAHPGNFLVDSTQRAWLVDLEKTRYGPPALDMAHATLYTSTTWDMASHAVLSIGEVVRSYQKWQAALPAEVAPPHWSVPLRRAMWLWSITWCAKWRVVSGRATPATNDGENWSTTLSEVALVRHVRDRVDHYLDAATVDQQRDEFDQLDKALRG